MWHCEPHRFAQAVEVLESGGSDGEWGDLSFCNLHLDGADGKSRKACLTPSQAVPVVERGLALADCCFGAGVATVVPAQVLLEPLKPCM